MAAFDDFLKEPRVHWMLVSLYRNGPMRFREFVHTSGFSPGTAQNLRNKMEKWGLIDVEGKGTWGATQTITLTRHGKGAAELALQQERFIDSREKKGS